MANIAEVQAAWAEVLSESSRSPEVQAAWVEVLSVTPPPSPEVQAVWIEVLSNAVLVNIALEFISTGSVLEPDTAVAGTTTMGLEFIDPGSVFEPSVVGTTAIALEFINSGNVFEPEAAIAGATAIALEFISAGSGFGTSPFGTSSFGTSLSSSVFEPNVSAAGATAIALEFINSGSAFEPSVVNSGPTTMRLTGFENGMKPPWSTDNEGGYTVISTSPRAGTYHGRMSADASGAGADLNGGSLTLETGMTWLGFAFKTTLATSYAEFSSTVKPIADIRNGTSGSHVIISLYPNGQLAVGIISSTEFATAPNPVILSKPVVIDNNWVYVELGASIDQTAGYAELRVNGEVMGTFTGDTNGGFSNPGVIRHVRLYGPSETTGSPTSDFDDVYITLEDGTAPVGFQGPGSVNITPALTLDVAQPVTVEELMLSVASNDDRPTPYTLGQMSFGVASADDRFASYSFAYLILEVMSSQPVLIDLDIIPGGGVFEPVLRLDQIIILEHIPSGDVYEPFVAAPDLGLLLISG